MSIALSICDAEVRMKPDLVAAGQGTIDGSLLDDQGGVAMGLLLAVITRSSLFNIFVDE